MDQSKTVIFIDMISIMFCLLLYTKVMALRQDTLKFKGMMYIGCALIIGVFCYAAYIYGLPASVAVLFFMTIPSFFWFLYLSKYRGSRFILTFCMVDTVILIITFISRCIIVYIAGSDYIVIGILCLLFIATYKAGDKYFRTYYLLLEEEKAGWGGMAAATVLIYFALIFFAAYPVPIVTRMEYVPVWLVFAAVVISCYVVFIHSIKKSWEINEKNQKLEREKEIYLIAYTDVLTGIYNRASFIDKTSRLEQLRQGNERICCIVMDLNNLKTVNDTMGMRLVTMRWPVLQKR